MSKCEIHVNNKYQDFIEQDKVLLKEVLGDIKKMHETSSSTESFRKKTAQYLKEINEDKLKADADEVSSLVKLESNYSRTMNQRAKGVPVAESIRSLLTPSMHNVDNAAVSIASINAKQTIKYQNMIEQGFSTAEHEIMAKGTLDHDIIKYMAGDKNNIDPVAQKMGDVYKKILDMTHTDKNNVGIVVNKIDNYVFNQAALQNADKMRSMGQVEWVKTQLADLDHAKSFPYMTAETDKIEYLNKVYDGALERGDEASITDWKLLKDKGILKSAVQSKYAKPRTLHYTPEGLVNQYKTFSDKPLVETMMAEIAKSARDVAIYDVLGPRGTNGLDSLVQKISRDLQKQMNDATDPKIKAKLEAELESIQQAKKGALLRDINQITNSNNHTYNERVKVGFNAARSVTNTMILGGVMKSALTDLAWGITNQHIQGKSFLHSMKDLASSMVESIPLAKRTETVTSMKIAQESVLTSMLQVQSAEGLVAKGTAKLNYMYSKVNPVQWQTRLHKAWSANVQGKDVGTWTGKSWDKLDPLAEQALKRSGINKADWPAMQAMREKVGKDYGDSHIVTSDNYHTISDEVAIKAIEDNKLVDPSFVPNNPAKYRAHLERRYDAFLQDSITTAVPMPGERAKGFLHGNGQAGEYGHETRKTLTMLKSFMVHQFALMDKVSKASPNKAVKARHLSGMVTGLVTMAYVVDCLDSAMKGEDMPDPTDPEVIKKAVLRSGISSVMGDIVGSGGFGGSNPVANFIAGPTLTKAGEVVIGATKALAGNFTENDARKLTKFVPGNNLMYLKLWNHHILDDMKNSSK